MYTLQSSHAHAPQGCNKVVAMLQSRDNLGNSDSFLNCVDDAVMDVLRPSYNYQ